MKLSTRIAIEGVLLLIASIMAAIITPVVFAVLGGFYLHIRGHTGPTHFHPAIMGPMMLGLILAPMILFGGIIFSVTRWLRHHRRLIGRCKQCGYDLRGNPSNTICPECGTR